MLYRLSHRFSVDASGRPLPPASATMAQAGAEYRAGRLDAAEQNCREVLAREPRHAEALHLLGVINIDRGDPEAALEYLYRAEHETPKVARLQYHIGNALAAQLRHAEAEVRFRRVLALDPGFVDACNNLGTALRAQGRHDEAETSFHDALALRPDYAPAHYNLGLVLTKRGELDAAVASFRTALSIHSPPPPIDRLLEVHDALAQGLMELERYDEALAVCRARCALKPDDKRGEWHEALALLTLGRFAEGLPKYEARWKLPGFRDDAEADLPPPAVPDLASLAGHRVLLRAEQGRGDAIQFCRYAPLVARRGASVTIAVPSDLVALMHSLSGIAAVTDDTGPDPPHDISAALLSLPLAFATELGTIPRNTPYLAPSPDRLAAWKQRLGSAVRPRIGLCWWGSQHIPERSIVLSDLAPLLSLPDIEFHALQKEISEPDLGWMAERGGLMRDDTALTDFAEAAALLALMDLVISIDTSVAHLAGAIGRPVWILLRRNPDWRWFTDRTDSPWYPTARLFRQGTTGGWAPVVDSVRTLLAQRFAGQG
jgi:tetratricopeptide (TPR) repeat protein